MFGDRSDIRCLIPCAIDQDPYFRLTRCVSVLSTPHVCAPSSQEAALRQVTSAHEVRAPGWAAPVPEQAGAHARVCQLAPGTAAAAASADSHEGLEHMQLLLERSSSLNDL